MIKAAGRTGDGRPLLILGLTEENVTRLTGGEPVRVPAAHLRALGLPPVEIAITYGPDEESIAAEIRVAGAALTARLLDPGPQADAVVAAAAARGIRLTRGEAAALLRAAGA
jgi:hypothetical protein